MPRSATARLFVAIDPPREACDRLAAWARLALTGRSARSSRSVRLLDPQTMHLTLCFIGARPVQELASIAAAVRGIGAPPVELSLGAPLWLPPRGPRTLALAVHDRTGGLDRLHEAVIRALAGAIDWQPERRRLKAHVTVARLGRDRSRDRRAPSGDLPLAPTPQLTFTAREVLLYRSWPAPAGASYEALETRGLSEASDSSSEAGGGEEPGAP